MPNIFPPLQGYSPSAQVDPDQASILGSVNAPSGASLALNSADNAVQAAQDKLAGDAPKKYDYSAHGVLGNIGHVLARTANIAGDILDPAATSLIPNSDLYNAHKRAGDLEEVDKATERQLAAQRESDSVANESANRSAEQQRFDAGAPQREAELAGTQATTEKTQQQTKPLSQSEADTYNHLYNSKGFSAGMTPEETTRLTEAHKTIAEMRAKEAEFKQRQTQIALQHQDTERDRALTRDIALQNHQDTMGQHEGDTGRKVLDKAEQSYRTGAQSADELEAMISGAEQGNKAMAQNIPLEGALAINTSQGVKRINRTEVDQFEGAGSLFDNIVGRLGKLRAGMPIPKEILEQERQLAGILRHGSYKTYSDTFDSAQKRYSLNNETKLPSPGGASSAGQSQTIRAKDPNGVLHEAPAGTPLPKGWVKQ